MAINFSPIKSVTLEIENCLWLLFVCILLPFLFLHFAPFFLMKALPLAHIKSFQKHFNCCANTRFFYSKLPICSVCCTCRCFWLMRRWWWGAGRGQLDTLKIQTATKGQIKQPSFQKIQLSVDWCKKSTLNLKHKTLTEVTRRRACCVKKNLPSYFKFQQKNINHHLTCTSSPKKIFNAAAQTHYLNEISANRLKI